MRIHFLDVARHVSNLNKKAFQFFMIPWKLEREMMIKNWNFKRRTNIKSFEQIFFLLAVFQVITRLVCNLFPRTLLAAVLQHFDSVNERKKRERKTNVYEEERDVNVNLWWIVANDGFKSFMKASWCEGAMAGMNKCLISTISSFYVYF